MLQESLDLRAETEDFHAFLKTLGAGDWERPTGFLGWTPWDVVAHLHFFDKVSLLAMTDVDAFTAGRDALIKDIMSGMSNAEIARRDFGDLTPEQLMDRWQQTNRKMAEELGSSDSKRRIPWFGPDMGVRMFTTARYMETWAHSQEVYDLMKAKRTHTDRIKHIATIGMKTFGWTFINRGLEVPGPQPHVRLIAPSGDLWEWNEPSEEERISGEAVDFCHVVTQGRNIADTKLEVVGDVASQWMAIAQCFAGGPVDPPKPGERTGV